MKDLSKEHPAHLIVTDDESGQRLDNFISRHVKGVPKSRLYRVIRRGEARVNGRRVNVSLRLTTGDRVRLPPLRTATPPTVFKHRFKTSLLKQVLYQDNDLLAINKPAGIAVHGGSGVSSGVIEQLRVELPSTRFVELVHRLDRETSGILLIAKKRAALLAMHKMLRAGEVDKYYLAIIKGIWPHAHRKISLPLNKYLTTNGERRVNVQEGGKPAITEFTLIKKWKDCSLLQAKLGTGRTHQIRVHLSFLGYPILGDNKYGDFLLNKSLRKTGIKRLFLHACQMGFRHYDREERIVISAPIPQDWNDWVQKLDNVGSLTALLHTGDEARDNKTRVAE
jgi:23S rRNA pseudouridine955/2504/2580 synthase